jgi:hypothetical protein
MKNENNFNFNNIDFNNNYLEILKNYSLARAQNIIYIIITKLNCNKKIKTEISYGVYYYYNILENNIKRYFLENCDLNFSILSFSKQISSSKFNYDYLSYESENNLKKNKKSSNIKLIEKGYKDLDSLIKNNEFQKLKNEIDKKDYKSKEILEQIIKDVYRTNMQLSFFFQPTNKLKNFNKEEILNIYEKRKNWDFSKIEHIYQYDNFENETHADVLTRILFTYSYIIKDVSYHQGMNELLAPIYYCYSYDKLYVEEKEDDIEADSFWSFYYLMNKVKHNFDEEQEGLFLNSEILGKCLEIVDNKIFLNLLEKNVKNEFYCFRWFILLFSQDFEIGDVLKLWDLIFSRENKNYFVFFICLGIIILRKDIILKGGMAEILQCFQSLNDILCDDLIYIAREIKNKYKNKLDTIIAQTEKEF